MATLPIVNGPQVQAQGGGNFLQTRIDPRAFGAATASAMGQFGQTLQQTAQVVQQISLRRDDADVMAAVAAARDRTRDYLYNPDTGLYTRQGANALGIQQDLDEFYAGLEDEFLPTLSSPAAQRAFSRALVNDRQSSLGTAATYELSQMESYRSNSAIALVNSAVEMAYQGWEDPAVIAQAITDARGAVVVSTMGQSPDATRLAELDATSRIHTAVISQMMVEDPIRAQQYYTSNIGQLTAQDSAAIQRALAPGLQAAEENAAWTQANAQASAIAAGMPMVPLTEEGAAAVQARTGTPSAATVSPETRSYLQSRVAGSSVDLSRASPTFLTRTAEVIRLAEEATNSTAVIESAYRTPERQAQLYTNYLITTGQLPRDGTYTYNGVAYRWNEADGRIALAASPGNSNHNYGDAFDLQAGPVLDWLHQNALMLKANYGLEFLPGNAGIVDPGHLQLADGSRPAGQQQPGMPAVTQPSGGPPSPTLTIRQSDIDDAPRIAYQQNLELFRGDVEAALVATIAGNAAAQTWIANGRTGLPPAQAVEVATALYEIQQNSDIPLTVQQVASPDGGSYPAYFADPRAIDAASLYARIAQQPAHVQAALYTRANQAIARQTNTATLQRQEDEQLAWQHIAAGGSLQTLPAGLLARLEPTYVNTLNSAATNLGRSGSAYAAETIPGSYLELSQMSDRELVNTDLLRYTQRLSQGDFEKVAGWQRDARQRLETGVQTQENATRLSQADTFRYTMEAAGFNLTDQREVVGQFRLRWNEMITNEQARRGPDAPRLTQAEEQDLLEVLLLQDASAGFLGGSLGIRGGQVNVNTDLAAFRPAESATDFDRFQPVTSVNPITGLAEQVNPRVAVVRAWTSINGIAPTAEQTVEAYNLGVQAALLGPNAAALHDGGELSRMFDSLFLEDYGRLPDQYEIETHYSQFLMNFAGLADQRYSTAFNFRPNTLTPPAATDDWRNITPQPGDQYFQDLNTPATPAAAVTPTGNDPNFFGGGGIADTFGPGVAPPAPVGPPPADAPPAATTPATTVAPPIPGAPPALTPEGTATPELMNRLGLDKRGSNKQATADDKEPVAPASYTVAAGDTLWEIAQDLLGDGNRYRELMTLNGITNERALQIGQVLTLPGATGAAEGAPTDTGVPLPRPRPDAAPVPLPPANPNRAQAFPRENPARLPSTAVETTPVTRGAPLDDLSIDFNAMTLAELTNYARDANGQPLPQAWEEANFRRRHEALIIINQNAQRPYPIPNKPRPLTRQQVDAANIPPDVSSTLSVSQQQQYAEERGLRTEPDTRTPGNGQGVATDPVVRSGLDDIPVPPEPLTDMQRLDAARAERGPIIGAPDATAAQPTEAQGPQALTPENIPVPTEITTLTDMTREDINRVMEFIIANKPERSQLSTGEYLVRLLSVRFGTTEELVRNYLNTR